MPESVWDYPRPPRVEHSSRRVRITFGGGVIADSTGALRVLETSHPPTYYLPYPDIVAGALEWAPTRTTFCEWKGTARYFDVIGPDGRRAENAAWTYPEPRPGFEELADYAAFYPGPMDECTVGGEVVRAQEGGFYGGWITSDITGPFKAT
jgi:uncharacterized protein (DUF427 family)